MNWREFDLFNPSEEHKMLREAIASFVKAEVEPQALEFDRTERFNLPLFRKLVRGVEPPAQVIDAFRDVQAARADQERMQNEAQTYAHRIIPEARGEASKITQRAEAERERMIADARGEAARFNSVLDEYKKAPDVTRRRLYLESIERIYNGMDKIILDHGKQGNGVMPFLPLNELMKNRANEPGKR